MIGQESTLVDVCFAVASALDAHGIYAILTGGAAAALYAPHDYASLDADFILKHDDALRAWTIRESPDLIAKFSEFERRYAAYGNKSPATE